MAFLSGPERAREILAPRGGLIVLDDGGVEVFGSVAESAPQAAEAVIPA